MTPFGSPADAGASGTSQSSTWVRGERPGDGLGIQTRSEVVARNGVVASSQPLATQAGIRILQAGGNAIDAAVSVAGVLAVVEPVTTGLGGDMFALIWSSRDRSLHGLSASGWSPRRWSREYFTDLLQMETMPVRGVHSIVVPGAVAGWQAIVDRFGTRSLSEILEPAVHYAEEGFGVHELAEWGRFSDILRIDQTSVDTWLPNGGAPQRYAAFRNPALGRALRQIQDGGSEAFYNGAIAQAIVRKLEGLGSAMVVGDLAAYEPEWVEPVSTSYGGYQIHQLPPPNQGFASLEMLNIVEAISARTGLDLSTLSHADVVLWHTLVEAKKLAYADLYRHNGDPRFVAPPVDRLLSKEYAHEVSVRVDPMRARPAASMKGIDGGTVYFACADRWGNMVSCVNSLFNGFGSGVSISDFGFLLANRGSGFVLDEGHPNVVAGWKRPFVTIMAGFITRNDRPVMAFGNMGGDTQPQAHAQHVVNMIDLGMNVQATADLARFHHDQLTDELRLDSELVDLVGSELSRMGHSVVRSKGHGGGYQGILYQPREESDEDLMIGGSMQSVSDGEQPIDGVYRAGSDLRKDGQAAGW